MRRPGAAVSRPVDRGRGLHATLIEPEQAKSRETGMIEYPLLPLDAWRRQAQEQEGDFSLWKLLLAFIGGVLSASAEIAEGAVGNEKN